MGYHVAEKWILSILEKYLDFARTHPNTYKLQGYVGSVYATYFSRCTLVSLKSVLKYNKIKKYSLIALKIKLGLHLVQLKGHSKKEAENLCAKEALLYYGQTIAS